MTARLPDVLRYHERSKHHPGAYAPGPGYLDWDHQPDPFRRFVGAPLHRLRLPDAEPGPGAGQPGEAVPAALTRATLSQLLVDALGLTAWKVAGEASWPLRANPSSGNLHPTEGYVLVPQLDALPAGLYHYAPREHALEERASLAAPWASLAGEGTFLYLGLTSIFWREAWKYGERAWRYCQHDVGHAAAAVGAAAAALGWGAWPVAMDDAGLAALLGVAGQEGPEAEHPDLLLAIGPRPPAPWPVGARVLRGLRPDRPAPLGAGHRPWPGIDDVALACARWGAPPGPPPATGSPTALPPGPAPATGSPTALPPGPAIRSLIRQRRSAVAMDGRSSLPASAFFGLLRRTLPGRSPLLAVPGPPAVHLLLYAHRVEGLEPGLYLLPRAPGAVERLRATLTRAPIWEPVADADPLICLGRGDLRPVARQASCGQDIAADGAFAVSMLAELAPTLAADGAWAYRRLFWEAGAIGQILYLEAEAAGLRGTGIGCFFDDTVHRLVGIASHDLQCLYNFAVGGPVDDPRLATRAPYHHLDAAEAGADNPAAPPPDAAP